MAALLEQLLQSPQLKYYAQRITDQLRLEEGAREEFRRHAREDEDSRAEFINGEVVTIMSNKERHALAVQLLETAISLYVRKTKLGKVRSEQALTEFSRNDYLPDLCYWRSERAKVFTGDTFLYPVPDFAIEVLSESTEQRDRGIKFEDYAAQGVEEYWIVDSERQTIEQYRAHNGVYALHARGAGESTLRCIVLGFDFPVKAAFDEATNLELVSAILKS